MFRDWLFGMVRICVQRDQKERFLNLCRNRGLGIYQVREENGMLSVRMRLTDYRQIRPVARKLRLLPIVKDRWGFPFLWMEWGRKRVYVAGFLLFLGLVCGLSRMVWSIDLEGCRHHTEEALLEYLEEQGVYCGMFHRKLDYKKTEDMIRLAYPDISWVSVERVGTKLHIRLKESKAVEVVQNSGGPAHLVSSRAGVVESIVTRSGTPMVKAGDQVEKGDILISGIVEVMGDYDTPVNTRLVQADGDVILVSERSYYSVREMEYEKKVYTGHKRMQIDLLGYGRTLSLPDPGQFLCAIGVGKRENKEDIMTEICRMRIHSSLEFPVAIRKKVVRSYGVVRLRYEKEEAEVLEQEKFNDYLLQLEKKGVLIREKNVKIESGDLVCVAGGKILVAEKEKQHREIQENEWRQREPDEYNGNDP